MYFKCLFYPWHFPTGAVPVVICRQQQCEFCGDKKWKAGDFGSAVPASWWQEGRVTTEPPRREWSVFLPLFLSVSFKTDRQHFPESLLL